MAQTIEVSPDALVVEQGSNQSIPVREGMPQNGVITFYAFSKNQMPVTIRPMVWSKNGLLYTGQGKHGFYELLTEEERRSLPFLFTPETAFVLQDRKTLDLDNNPYEAALWKWVQHSPYISPSREYFSSEARFFIYSPKRDAEIYVKSTEEVDNARYNIRNISYEKLSKICEALGLYRADTYTHTQLLDWALHEATDPKKAKLFNLLMGEHAEARLNAMVFMERLLKNNILTKDHTGYYYGTKEAGKFLGLTKDEVIDYMLDKNNVGEVKVMKVTLAEKTKSSI